MCDCDQQISSLVDALKPGSSSEWEYSEPITMGGSSNTYIWQSPFVGPSEWSVAVIANLAEGTWVFGPNEIRVNGVGSGLASVINFNGYIFNVSGYLPANVLTPYAYTHAGIVYGFFTSASNGYATLIFRQKRG